jgi:hypothetical protein
MAIGLFDSLRIFRLCKPWRCKRDCLQGVTALPCRSHSPDNVPDIVGHKQGANAIHRDADGPTERSTKCA